jgi:NAD+ diphosphatase
VKQAGATGWDGRPFRFPLGEPPLLSRAAVDRAAERRTDRGWLAMAWLRGSVRVLRVGPGGQVPGAAVEDPAAQGFSLPWVEGNEVAPEPPPGLVLLGVHEKVVYAAVLDESDDGPGLRELGMLLGPVEVSLLVTAVALAAWHATHRFCPGCGTPTEVSQGGWARHCPRERTEHFPRTDPAVIVLVTSPDGESAVLGRQPAWPPGRYSCLAGFVEAGESAEQAVVRECREEAGLEVRDVVPIGSQPWPFPRSLMLGYRAVADADAVPTQADGELADVRWFSRDDVAGGAVMVPPPLSIASHLIGGWLAES